MSTIRIEMDNFNAFSTDEKSKFIDEEVEKFSIYMATLGDWKQAGPLNKQERMLIKSYLVCKLAGKIDKDDETDPGKEPVSSP